MVFPAAEPEEEGGAIPGRRPGEVEAKIQFGRKEEKVSFVEEGRVRRTIAEVKNLEKWERESSSWLVPVTIFLNLFNSHPHVLIHDGTCIALHLHCNHIIGIDR